MDVLLYLKKGFLFQKGNAVKFFFHLLLLAVAVSSAQTFWYPNSQNIFKDPKLQEFVDLMSKGEELHNHGLYKESIETYHQAEESFPRQDELADLMESTLDYEIALSFFADGQNDSALFHAQKSIGIRPSAEGYSIAAQIFEKWNRLDSALAYYDKGISLFPNGATLYYNKLIALENFHLPREAYAVGMEGVRHVKHHPKLYLETSRLAIGNQEWIEFFADGVYALATGKMTPKGRSFLKEIGKSVSRDLFYPVSEDKIYTPHVHELWFSLISVRFSKRNVSKDSNDRFNRLLKGGNKEELGAYVWENFIRWGTAALEESVLSPYNFALKPLFKELVEKNQAENFLKLVFRSMDPSAYQTWKFYHKAEFKALGKTLKAYIESGDDLS